MSVVDAMRRYFYYNPDIVNQITLSPSDRRALGAVVTLGEAKPEDVAKTLDIKLNTAQHAVEKLTKKGYLTYEDTRKTGAGRKTRIYKPSFSLWFGFQLM